MAERLYLTHYNRGEEFCPLCFASILWRKVGERQYCPCDRIPVLCKYKKGARLHVVKKGQLITGVEILTKENPSDFVGVTTFHALQPHVYTCQQLKKYRRHYRDAQSRSLNGTAYR